MHVSVPLMPRQASHTLPQPYSWGQRGSTKRGANRCCKRSHPRPPRQPDTPQPFARIAGQSLHCLPGSRPMAFRPIKANQNRDRHAMREPARTCHLMRPIVFKFPRPKPNRPERAAFLTTGVSRKEARQRQPWLFHPENQWSHSECDPTAKHPPVCPFAERNLENSGAIV